MNTQQNTEDGNNKTNPLAIVSLALGLLAVFLFLQGFSNLPNKPLSTDIPLPSALYALSAIIAAIVAKVCWSKAAINKTSPSA
jgi:hypothetical protein